MRRAQASPHIGGTSGERERDGGADGRRQPDRLEQTVREAPLPPAWHATFVAETLSTQDLARAALKSGAPAPTVFVADYQTAGRGRQGRQWVAPPGSSLVLSILFREAGADAQPLRYTFLTSVALAEAVERVAPGLTPAIKWPNDLMLNGRKAAGVLAESAWDGERLAVIVGVGANVRLDDAVFARLGTATAIEREAGHPVDRGALFLALVERLAAWHDQPMKAIRDTWQTRLWGQGQRLRLRGIEGDEREQVGLVLGVEEDGALRVQLDDGSVVRTTTCELIL